MSMEHPPTVESPVSACAREQQKTPDQRAEDIAYTINHAVSCATTDMVIAPTVSALMGSRNLPDMKSFLHEAGHYLKGEIIGDFSAVPLTIFVQRRFPAFMASVSRVVEPVAKPFFRHGARIAAERWGRKHDIATSDPEVAARAQEIFQHEIEHLPQAVVWNMFSFPLGVIGQRAFGHPGSYGEIARNKLLGTAISNVLLIGGRALIPDKAEKFDRLDGKYVIRPATRALSGLFGIDRTAVDRMDAKAARAEARADGHWQRQVSTPAPASAAPER